MEAIHFDSLFAIRVKPTFRYFLKSIFKCLLLIDYRFEMVEVPLIQFRSIVPLVIYLGTLFTSQKCSLPVTNIERLLIRLTIASVQMFKQAKFLNERDKSVPVVCHSIECQKQQSAFTDLTTGDVCIPNLVLLAE